MNDVNRWLAPLHIGARVWVYDPVEPCKATITDIHHRRTPPTAISLQTLEIGAGNYDFVLRFDGRIYPEDRVFAAQDLKPLGPVELLVEGIS